MTDDLGATIGEIADRLDSAGIPYMIVGSIAALVHGRARATMDVDIVIDPAPSTLDAFVAARQLEDVRALVELAGAGLDLAYLDTQFAALGLVDVWQPIRPSGG
ncbi:MAG TPA: hypothetical protein VG755_04030 [Nannocystaceae bacterium]|nr:hypothetical protein [Nannocystaceae bacterium]